MKKRLVSLLLAACMVSALASYTAIDAEAASATICDTSDPRIDDMMDAIDQQNFSGTDTDAETVKSYIQHYIFTSDFSAVNGGEYPYPNSGEYVTSVSDGTYAANIRGSKGCCSYCYYVSNVVYGTEGSITGKSALTPEALRQLLLTYGQAGDHLRVDGKHSVTFISCDDSGFYSFSYRGDNNPCITLDYWTYEAFSDYYSGYDIWLYDANTAVNLDTFAADESGSESEKKQQKAGLHNFITVNKYYGQFEDIAPSAWYYDNVTTAYNLALMKGSGSTCFNAAGTVTLAEAIAMACRLHSIYYTGIESFVQTDDEWYQVYVNYAWDNDILPRKYKDYNKAASREQFAEIFANALPEEALMQINTISANAIPDVSASASYADAVYRLYRAGILTGSNAQGAFLPDSTISRTEASAIITRMADPSLRQSIAILR